MYSNGLVVLLGLGIVFAGLIGVILICYIMSAVVASVAGRASGQAASGSGEETPAQAPMTAAQKDLEKNKKVIAIILTVLSEELGASPAEIDIKKITKI